MYTKDIKILSKQFWLNQLLIKSWFLKWEFYDIESWVNFFKYNIDVIKAQPFVKWVWWKRQLISQFEKLFPKEFNNYFEPFLWWWAVFFNLQKEKSFLSDINEELINTYKIIKSKPKKLIEFLKTLEYSKECFINIRSWDREKDWTKKYTDIQRAGRFIYLNRTCFNWLYRVNSKNEFNVPFGSYTNPDFVQEENIINVSKLLKYTKAEIKVQSFDKVIEKAVRWDFVYFDPPYDVLSDTANFTSYVKGGFGQEWQKKLAETFKQLDNIWIKVMLSNHDTPLIRKLYKWYKFRIVKARRNINSKGDLRWQINEIVVLNY